MTLSPELGSIDVAPSPTREASGRNYLAGVGSALVGTIRGIQDKNSMEDAADDFNEITDDVLGQAQQPTEDDPDFRGPPSSRGSREAQILGNIRTLQAGVDQATGSRKADLELKLRQKVTELGDADPRLRQRYASELARFTRTDPELFAIGMLDTANKAFSAQQAKDLQAIKDHAQDDLGMDPAMTFGDVAWVREYMYLDNLDNQTEKNNLVLGALESGEQLDARDSAEAFQASMQGTSNRVKAGVKKATQLAMEVGQARRDPTLPGAAEAIAQWEDWGKDAVLQDLNMELFQIEETFGAIPTNQAHTTAYQGAKALRDSQTAAIGALIEGINTDSPTVSMAYEAYQTMMAIDFERKNPKFVNDARNMKLIEPMLALIDADFGAQGDILRHELAGFLKQGAENVMGRSFGRTRLDDLPPDATAAEIKAHSRAIRQDSGNLYDNGQQGAQAQRLFASTDISLKSSPGYLKMAEDGSGLAPHVAATQVASIASEIDQLLTTGQAEEDGLRQAMTDLQNPLWLNMAAVAQKSNHPAAVVAMGEEIQNLVWEYEPYRLANYNQLRTTPIGDGNVLAAQAIFVDDSNIHDEGEVTFRVNEDYIRENVPHDPTMPRVVELAIQQAYEVAAELSRAVTRDVRVMAHGSAMTQGLTKPSYVQEWERNKFERYFGTLPSQQPSPNDKQNTAEQ